MNPPPPPDERAYQQRRLMLRALGREVGTDEKPMTTREMAAAYEVTGFGSHYVVVRRRADSVLGTLQFTDRPRLYFGWEIDPPITDE